MRPEELIGLEYRLGACPVKHGKADCLSIAATVVNYFGYDAPEPKRDWYRRLRRGDSSVFREELEAWGVRTTTPRIGVVALCVADNGYGLAVYWNDGWLSYVASAVRWSPIDLLPVVGLYYPRKQNSAILLD